MEQKVTIFQITRNMIIEKINKRKLNIRNLEKYVYWKNKLPASETPGREQTNNF